MKSLLFVVVFIVAVVLGIFVHHDPGYALFAYGKWTVELPLWLSLVLIIAAVIALGVLNQVVGAVFSSVGLLKAWRKRSQKTASLNYTLHGLLALAEGRWAVAEKVLLKGAKYSDAPLVNYLSAAKAAQELQAPDLRDKYLRLAHESAKGSDVAVRLTQAKLQFQCGQLEQSLATLKSLQKVFPRHKQVLKHLKRVYEVLEDWHALHIILSDLKREKVYSSEALDLLEKNILMHLLEEASHKSSEALAVVWNNASKKAYTDLDLIRQHIKGLIKTQDYGEAEGFAMHALKKHWDPGLVRLVGSIQSADQARQLSLMEGWLKSHPNDPVLLLTLGKLCTRNQLWGKAKDYLKASLGQAPTAEGYWELAKLLAYLGEEDRSAQCYKAGLELTVT